ncbi:MAG: hypothetical protein WBG38_13505 [Nodosilinea sp.]
MPSLWGWQVLSDGLQSEVQHAGVAAGSLRLGRRRDHDPDKILAAVQQALQESEARFQQLAEAVQEGFFVYETASAHYSYVNSAYWVVRGLSPNSDPDSLEQWKARIHPGDRACVEAALVREQQGEPFDQEYRYMALLDTGMNPKSNVSRRGKQPFAPTRIHVSIQQRPRFFIFSSTSKIVL